MHLLTCNDLIPCMYLFPALSVDCESRLRLKVFFTLVFKCYFFNMKLKEENAKVEKFEANDEKLFYFLIN